MKILKLENVTVPELNSQRKGGIDMAEGGI